MDKHNRDLLIHALKGTLDTASRREFDLWVSNADNLRIYENALRIWDDAQRRAAAYTPDRDRLWEQLQSRIGVSGSPQPTERPAPKRRWVPILRTAAAVAAGVVVTLFAVRPDAALTPSPARQEFCAFGGKSLAHLADGSTVWLQSGSTLACDGSFGAESRNVKLRGEGFFDIAKDPERPFTVEVEGLRIRVHGTKFNVNTSLEDRTVAVSLVEGSVALDSGEGEQRQLHPGEIARYNTPHKSWTSVAATWSWNPAGPRANWSSSGSRWVKSAATCLAGTTSGSTSLRHSPATTPTRSPLPTNRSKRFCAS